MELTIQPVWPPVEVQGWTSRWVEPFGVVSPSIHTVRGVWTWTTTFQRGRFLSCRSFPITLHLSFESRPFTCLTQWRNYTSPIRFVSFPLVRKGRRLMGLMSPLSGNYILWLSVRSFQSLYVLLLTIWYDIMVRMILFKSQSDHFIVRRNKRIWLKGNKGVGKE